MADVAKRAGVSRVAVSYALNGRAGVSAEVRGRILRIADEIGFAVNGAARALRSDVPLVAGLTLRRPAGAASVEVFRRELISGVQVALGARGFALALQFVADRDDELSVFQRWAAERRVSGVFVLDLERDDPRVPALARLGLPAVVVGGPVDGAVCIWGDDAAPMAAAVHHLAGLGHRRVARVSGPPALHHTAVRDAAFTRACDDHGATGTVVAADCTGEDGARVTRRLLASTDRPTALVYDNDIMAVAGLGVAAEMGLAVPAALAIVALEDSALCQVVRPALTVLKRDITGYGTRAAEMLLALVDGDDRASVCDHTATLVKRGTT